MTCLAHLCSQYPPLSLPLANLLTWQLLVLLTLFCPEGYSLVASQIKYLIGVGIVLLVIKNYTELFENT